jgi:ribA/ribD-fused uncharacterized protein
MRSKSELVAAWNSGARPTFLTFWGHRPGVDGVVTRSCLSQWYLAPFEVDGTRYPTAEHFMMAGKARMFGDGAALARILASEDPSAAKAAGRRVQSFDEARWATARFDLVVAGNIAKFSQHARLRKFLIATGEQVLIEASPRDAVWGIGLGETDPHVIDPNAWPGENLLGFALMQVRDFLRGRAD